MLENIVFIGAGNLATHLALALNNAGKKIIQVYSRTYSSASQLAIKVDAEPINDIKLLNKNADIYIVSVKDSAIEHIASNIKLNNKLIVHTSGSMPMEVLKEASDNYGVLYPLQTFSKNKNVDFHNVPICIETNNPANIEILKNLAEEISSNVREISFDKRRIIHLAAVFACNFTNNMYSVAEQLLIENDISFNILLPLINETAVKVFEDSPKKLQTGPAVRGDDSIISSHLKMLANYKDFKKIYKLLSDNIKKMNNK